MKRKILASLAVMSICLCSCQSKTKAEHVTSTPASTSSPQTIATQTPTAEPAKTTAPQKTPASNQTAQNTKLSLTSKMDLKGFTNVKELSIGDSTNADFVLHTNGTLKDLTVNSVNNDGVTCKISKKQYEKPQFTKNDAVHIKTYIPDTFSNLLISYKDSNDKTVYKMATFSMNDGNIVLEDIDSTKITK